MISIDLHRDSLINIMHGKFDSTLITIEQIDPGCPIYQHHVIPTNPLLSCHSLSLGGGRWLVGTPG